MNNKLLKIILIVTILLSFTITSYALPIEYISLDNKFLAVEGNNGIFVVNTPTSTNTQKTNGFYGANIYTICTYRNDNETVSKQIPITLKFKNMPNENSYLIDFVNTQKTTITIFNSKGEKPSSIKNNSNIIYPIQKEFSDYSIFNTYMPNTTLYFPTPSQSDSDGIYKFFLMIDGPFAFDLTTASEQCKIFSIGNDDKKLVRDKIMTNYFNVEPVDENIFASYGDIEEFILSQKTTPFQEYSETVVKYAFRNPAWADATYNLLTNWWNRRNEYIEEILSSGNQYSQHRFIEVMENILPKTDSLSIRIENSEFNYTETIIEGIKDIDYAIFDDEKQISKKYKNLLDNKKIFDKVKKYGSKAVDLIKIINVNYNNEMSNLSALESVYTEYCPTELDIDIQSAIIALKGKYSDKFSSELLDLINDETLKKIPDKIFETNIKSYTNILDIINFASNIASDYSGIKSGNETTEILTFSNILSFDIMFAMSEIESRVKNSKHDLKDLRNYENLFYIQKALRKYQYETICNYIGKSSKNYDKYYSTLEEICGTYISITNEKMKYTEKNADVAQKSSVTYDPFYGTSSTIFYEFKDGFINGDGNDLELNYLDTSNTNKNDNYTVSISISISSDNKEWINLNKITKATCKIDLSDNNIEKGKIYKYIRIELNKELIENTQQVKAFHAINVQQHGSSGGRF